MEFANLHNDIKCNCTDNCYADTVSLFAMKTMKSFLREADFLSYWQKGKRPIGEECKDICSYKGNSMSIFTDESKEVVKAYYKAIFPIAPGYKPFISIIKFKDDSGVVKHTPDEGNPHHYDFYKCDTFLQHKQVELIESKSFAEE